tara:strand:+ start:339 stop:1160 length:822 start_codon:yes stop_codon:yes gene_type:complete
MSFFRFDIETITRSTGGSAVRRSAYQRCVKSECGKYDYSSHRDEYILHEVLLPEGVESRFLHPETLWREAERMERRPDSQLGRAIEISIPDEVPRCLCQKLAREILFPYVDHDFAVEYSIHRRRGIFKKDDNVRIHALVSTRQIGEEGFRLRKDRYFERRFLRKGRGSMLRKATAEVMNFFFLKNKVNAFVDHEKNELEETLAPSASQRILQEIKREMQGLKRHVEAGATASSYKKSLSLTATMFLLSQAQKKDGLNELCEAVGDLDERKFGP